MQLYMFLPCVFHQIVLDGCHDAWTVWCELAETSPQILIAVWVGVLHTESSRDLIVHHTPH